VVDSGHVNTMKTFALLIVTSVLVGQAMDPSARDLLRAARGLSSAEIATVLAAARNALSEKTFRLRSGRPGQPVDVLMGRDGLPKLIRVSGALEGGSVGGVVPGFGMSGEPTRPYRRQEFVNITHYTGGQARGCDGTPAPGLLVVEYKLDVTTQRWTTVARQGQAGDFGGPEVPIFEMLQGAGPITSGERRRIGDRWARAFNLPWTSLTFSTPPLVTGDPIPNVAGVPAPDETVQSLWIDTETLLPLRWEVSNVGLITFGFDFSYASIDLRPPPGVDAPECIR
jgi:hypothetical protein